MDQTEDLQSDKVGEEYNSSNEKICWESEQELGK